MKKLYEILEENPHDYNLGFEVQSPEKEFVLGLSLIAPDWDIVPFNEEKTLVFNNDN